ncbi:MAG: hypothetical protein JO281_04985 [Pseudonocardiales bacterium]|nr:hypothetical protein [Pseudonocardiales bacterium]
MDRALPDNLGELLFDDVPWRTAAQCEHDVFTTLLRRQGVEVCYLDDPVTRSLSETGCATSSSRPRSTWWSSAKNCTPRAATTWPICPSRNSPRSWGRVSHSMRCPRRRGGG